ERAHLRPRHVGAGAGPVGDDLPGAGREVGGPAAGAEDDPPARDHRPHLASVCLAGTAPSAPVRRGAANQALDPRGSHDHRIPDRRVAGRHPGDAPAADLGGGAGGTGRDPAVRLLGADGTILRLDHRPAAHRRLPGGLLLVERRVRVLRRPPAALGERPGGGAHGVPVHGPDVRGDRAPHGPFPPGPGLRGGHPGSDLRVDRDLRRRAGGDGAAVVAAVPPRRAPLPGPLRLVVAAQGMVFAVAGTALLAAPEAASWWPWDLTALTGRAIGAWLVSFGLAAFHSLAENCLMRLRPAVWAYVA